MIVQSNFPDFAFGCGWTRMQEEAVTKIKTYFIKTKKIFYLIEKGND